MSYCSNSDSSDHYGTEYLSGAEVPFFWNKVVCVGFWLKLIASIGAGLPTLSRLTVSNVVSRQIIVISDSFAYLAVSNFGRCIN